MQPVKPFLQSVQWGVGAIDILAFIRLISRKEFGEIDTKRTELRLITTFAHLEHHHQTRHCVVRVDEKNSSSQMEARFLAEPSDHFHSAIIRTGVDELFSAKIVVKMNFVPRLDQTNNAIRHGFYPNGFWFFYQKRLGPSGIVVEKQEASRFALHYPPPQTL